MAIDDNTSYELTGAQVKDLASKINAKADSANLATVATSGSYNDLSNKPTIPAAQVNSDWDAASGVAQILNKPSLATVATSGSYSDLSNKPTIPDPKDYYWANVKVSDTSSTNTTPTFQSASFTGSYPQIIGNNNLYLAAKSGWTAGTGSIVLATNTFRPSSSETQLIDLGASNALWKNLYLSGDMYHGSYKLTLPNKAGTVALTSDIGNATLTVQKNGTTVDTFTANATSNKTINITTDYNKTADNLTPTADTTAAWKTALNSKNGAYLTWYSSASKFTNQPAQYGFLETFLQGSDIYQRWHTQSSGPILYRSGNGTGWSNPSDGTWNTVATTANIGNATLTIQKNSTTVDTFTANATSDKTVNIEVPTAVSELTNDAGYITDADIPTVNDATLTIQKNGTTVTTFTANSSTNKTANITATDVTVTDTDPGEGSVLAANTLLGVYDIAPEDVDGSRLINNTVTWAKIAQATMPKAKIALLSSTNGSFAATDKGVLIVDEQFQNLATSGDCTAKVSFSGASGATVTPRASQNDNTLYTRGHVFGLALVNAGDSVTWTVTYSNAGIPAQGSDGGFSLFIPCNW